MTREQIESYEQDRLGNARRALDTIRAQDGMAGADADNSGIMDIPTGDTGTNQIVYELPDDADSVYLDLVHAHNDSGGPGTFRILEATLDDNGNITGTTRRSVLINVADTATRSIGYEGVEFTEDAIVINSGFQGEFGVAVLADNKEYTEPNSEQTQAP